MTKTAVNNAQAVLEMGVEKEEMEKQKYQFEEHPELPEKELKPCSAGSKKICHYRQHI